MCTNCYSGLDLAILFRRLNARLVMCVLSQLLHITFPKCTVQYALTVNILRWHDATKNMSAAAKQNATLHSNTVEPIQREQHIATDFNVQDKDQSSLFVSACPVTFHTLVFALFNLLLPYQSTAPQLPQHPKFLSLSLASLN